MEKKDRSTQIQRIRNSMKKLSSISTAFMLSKEQLREIHLNNYD
jgi:hypothetical protein